MELLELSIQWRSGARVHHLVIDAEGVPHLDGDAPFAVPTPRPRAEGPAQRGKAWSPEDEAVLRDGFAADEPPAEMARRLGRSRGAVVARLVRLGLLDEAAAGLRYPVQRGSEPTAPSTEG